MDLETKGKETAGRLTHGPVFCPVVVTLAVMGGKYKPLLLYHIEANKVLRFGQLRQLVSDASKKMLTQQLRELEADGLIRRKVYKVVPPKVEYSLTERGKSLQPVLREMGRWGASHARYYGKSIGHWQKKVDAELAPGGQG
jgi:DNA-binding HxlR family transcriptional regulator